MVLCSLCASIPINSLPRLSSAYLEDMTDWDLINDYSIKLDSENTPLDLRISLTCRVSGPPWRSVSFAV